MPAKKRTARQRANKESSQKKKRSGGLLIYAIVAVICIASAGIAYFYLANSNGDQQNNPIEENPLAIINTSLGTITIELYKDKVPDTCENFIDLANDGFYDGLVFHRVIDGFMIQTGGFDPEGNQHESPYGTIDLEIDQNLRHIDGAVAMARQGQDMTDPTYFNTATNQFYICDGAQHQLDDYYAVFGQVIEGMNVVHDISAVSTQTRTIPAGYPMSNWPIDDIVINSIIIENQEG